MRSRLSPSACWLLLPLATLVMLPARTVAQVNYVARFTLDKPSVVAGEPVFCTFTIENTGTKAFAFAYRNPSRIANNELESEPDFIVRDAAGRHPQHPSLLSGGGL